ncbi:hypothetical protein [Zhihengliuella halotolerans]|uniref:hypothetical protein n=1 Tax=Zhihengliuella halotolerans TaxID=370736 RepID=UPI0011AF460E|nr:hypothetical protein [Zhihengliuella halotolerans]
MPDPTQHPLGPLDGWGRFDWERAIKRCEFGSTATRLVALTMATWADNETGYNVRPGRDRLSLSTGLHLVTVTRSINSLRDLGLVVELSRGRLGKGGQAKASEYALSFPRVAANLINSFAATTDKNGKKLLFQDKDMQGRFIPVLFPLEAALKDGMGAAERKYREGIADHYESLEVADVQGRSDAPALGTYEAPELPRSEEARTYLASDVDLPSNEPNLGSAGVETLVAEALPQGSVNSHLSSLNTHRSLVPPSTGGGRGSTVPPSPASGRGRERAESSDPISPAWYASDERQQLLQLVQQAAEYAARPDRVDDREEALDDFYSHLEQLWPSADFAVLREHGWEPPAHCRQKMSAAKWLNTFLHKYQRDEHPLDFTVKETAA